MINRLGNVLLSFTNESNVSAVPNGQLALARNKPSSKVLSYSSVEVALDLVGLCSLDTCHVIKYLCFSVLWSFALDTKFLTNNNLNKQLAF